MTDEEIERALEIHYRRGGLPNCETCPYYKEFCHGDCLRAFGKDMQDYITRLKAENDILKKNAAEAYQQWLNEKRELIEPEIRQETAKEILQELDSRLWDDIDMNSDIGGAEHNQTIRSLIKFVKKKYSVEIEE